MGREIRYMDIKQRWINIQTVHYRVKDLSTHKAVQWYVLWMCVVLVHFYVEYTVLVGRIEGYTSG